MKMYRFKNKFHRYTFKSIVIITIYLFAIIAIGTVTNAKKFLYQNIFSPFTKMGLLVVLICIIGSGYIYLFRFFNHTEERNIIISTVIMSGLMLLIYFLVLYNIQPFSSSDAYNVQDLALYLAKTGKTQVVASTPHAAYFGYYANNYFLTILLAKYFKILLMFGVKDIYLPLYLLSIAGMLITTLFMYLTGGRIGGIRGGAKILSLCLGNPLYYLLPLWAYTNAFSIPFTVAVVYFSVRLFHENNWKDRFISSAFLGICFSVGYYIRPTVLIPVIALGLCVIVELIAGKQRWRTMMGSLAVFIGVSAVCVVGISNINKAYFSQVSSQNFPITHWMMMASHGTGELNLDDYYYTCQFPTKEEKQKATLKKMEENYERYSPLELYSFLNKKMNVSWCYADGKDLRDKISQNRKNTVLYNWIIGSESDLFRTYCYAFRIVMIGFIFIALWQILKKRAIDVNQIFFAVAFIGGVCFYSIWEIKASYGMPFLMFILLIATDGIDFIARNRKESSKKEFSLRRKKLNNKKVILIICVLCIMSSTYIEMTKSITPHINWEVHCANIGSIKCIEESQDPCKIKQSFYASKPYNRITLMVGAEGKAKNENAHFDIMLEDKYNKELYHGRIYAKDLKEQQEVTLSIPQIKPCGKMKYNLFVTKEKGYRKTLNIYKRRESNVGSYKGSMTVNGKKKFSHLYLAVYQYSRGPWCSTTVAIFINLCMGIVAIIFIIMWPIKYRNCTKKKEEILNAEIR